MDGYPMYLESNKRGDKRMKSFMEKNKIKTAGFIVLAHSKETDKGRGVVDYDSYAIPIEYFNDENMPDSLKKKERKTSKKYKINSAHSWEEVPIDNESVESICSICEKEGDNFDSKTDFYRYLHKKEFVDTGKCRDYLFTKEDGSEPIGRGYASLLSGRTKKYRDIVNGHVCSIGGKVVNTPTDETWIRNDYDKGNISSIDVITYGTDGGKSPIYFYDKNTDPNNPYNPENNNSEIKDLREKGLSEEEIRLIINHRHLNDKNN